VFLWSDLAVCTKLAQFTTSACITHTHTLSCNWAGISDNIQFSKVDEQHYRPMYESSHFERPNVLKNFRPASNLPFVSKPTEKIVLDQLLCHLDYNNLWHTIQSAYLPKQDANLCFQWPPDCFRLWLCLHSDSSGSKCCHQHYSILLTRLRNIFGICDLALSFGSYLQVVTANEIKSSPLLPTGETPRALSWDPFFSSCILGLFLM